MNSATGGSKVIAQKYLDSMVNTFAVRSFRHVADADYIAARMACRAGLMNQFLWSSQQAIEKYLKAILLFNRIPAVGVGHDLAKALQLTDKLRFKLDLRPDSRKFFDHVATYGSYRYLEVSSHVVGPALLNLDMTIWDIRRYCQFFDVPGENATSMEIRIYNLTWESILRSAEKPAPLFQIHGGLLEDIISRQKHPAREPLLWQNAFFGRRHRQTIKVVDQMQITNAPLWLHPEMLDELVKYVFLPKDLIRGYREHLANIVKDPTKRP